jgi:hypothetical protein
MCTASVAVSKKHNVERHFMTMHKRYVRKYTDNSEMNRNKAEDLERNLRSPRAIFSESALINKARLDTIASCNITDFLAKKRKPLEYGSVVKE